MVTASFAAAVLLLKLQLPLVTVRGPRVVGALGGTLIDLVIRGGRVHRVHGLVPALGNGHSDGSRRRWLQGRWSRQGIATVAGPVLGAPRCIQARLILAGRMALGGKGQVIGGHHSAWSGGGEVSWELRRVLAGGCNLVAVLGTSSNS